MNCYTLSDMPTLLSLPQLWVDIPQEIDDRIHLVQCMYSVSNVSVKLYWRVGQPPTYRFTTIGYLSFDEIMPEFQIVMQQSQPEVL